MQSGYLPWLSPIPFRHFVLSDALISLRNVAVAEPWMLSTCLELVKLLQAILMKLSKIANRQNVSGLEIVTSTLISL